MRRSSNYTTFQNQCPSHKLHPERRRSAECLKRNNSNSRSLGFLNTIHRPSQACCRPWGYVQRCSIGQPGPGLIVAYPSIRTVCEIVLSTMLIVRYVLKCLSNVTAHPCAKE